MSIMSPLVINKNHQKEYQQQEPSSAASSNPQQHQHQQHQQQEPPSHDNEETDTTNTTINPQPEQQGGDQPSRDYDPATRVYTLEQLSVLNLVVQPIWIFDYVQRQMRWANPAGLRLFNAATVSELQQRDFSVISAAAAQRMDDFLVQIAQGRNVSDQWTLYPKGEAKTVHMNVSGVRIVDNDDNDNNDNHMSLLCEGLPLVRQDLLNNNLRGVEMLRHLPMAVCQFDMNGQPMFQNPEASLMLDLEQQLEPTSTSTVPPNKEQENGTTQTTNTEPDEESSHPEEIEDDDDGDDDDDDNNNNTDPNKRGASAEGAAQTKRKRSANTSKKDDLLHRFVDPVVGQQVLKEIQQFATHHHHHSNNNTKQNDTTIDLEAVVHTRYGPTVSAIQLRKVNDPITGEPVILYSARDKTDAVQARQERQAREQKTEFFAILAHEIRTPLHQVIGFIDLLDQTRLNAEQSSYVKLLRSSAQGLMAVISDVLDFSKLEAGKMKLECVPYEPRSVVTGSLDAIRASCEEKKLQLHLEWHKDIPFRLEGDPNRLRQILLNLLSNAVKFTRNGGIHVQAFPLVDNINNNNNNNENGPADDSCKDGVSAAASSSSLVKFVVSDTGNGISAEEVDIIFLKYQQANVSVARNYGGTGLGLSICKILVENMGGSIGVDSVLGHGASFWFVLPANIPTESDDATESKLDDLAQDVGGLRILVAEDNLVNQKLVSKMLTRMGHQSCLAKNGKEAIEKVEANEYDAILMDIQMPVMDGLEATRRLRTMGYTDLPIYALTASVARPDFSELGFTDWIPKPIPMKDLKAKLYRLQQKNTS